MSVVHEDARHERDALSGLHPGDHICCFYRDAGERDSLLASFIRNGLQNNEKVACAVDEQVLRRCCRTDDGDHMDITPYRSSGQLVVLDPEEFYLSNGSFTPADALQQWDRLQQQARDEGYERLRITGDVPPQVAGTEQRTISAYEARVDRFLTDNGCAGLCLYDRRRWPPRLLRRILQTHPVISIDSRLYRNFYYTCPATPGTDTGLKNGLQRWLDNLVEHRELQDQLRRTGNRYRAIFENSGAAICIIEEDTTISLINPEFERLVGYSRQEVEGRMSWTQMVAPEDRERMQGFHRRRRKNPRAAPTSYEFQLLHKNGDIRHVFVRVDLIPGTKQSTASILDISERKRMQQKLRESEREKRMILQSSPALIAYQDMDHNIKWVNQGAAEAAGEPKEALEGRKCYEVWHNRDRPCEECPVCEAKETGRQCAAEIRTPEGTTYRINGRPARNEDGRMIGAVETAVDITGQKKAEQDLEESQRRLRALTDRLQDLQEQERRRLSRTIHDELGHQLTAMKIGLSRLQKKAESESADPSALNARIDDLSALVDEAIDSVHQVAQRLRPDALDDLGLEAALETEIEEFEGRTGIDCTLHCDPSAGQQDEARSTALFRICQELLDNVARHADATQVEVRLEQENQAVQLQVADNGRGISEEEAWAPDSLGLLGIRERARALGGRVSIDGKPGEKTIARVALPLTEETARSQEAYSRGQESP